MIVALTASAKCTHEVCACARRRHGPATDVGELVVVRAIWLAITSERAPRSLRRPILDRHACHKDAVQIVLWATLTTSFRSQTWRPSPDDPLTDTCETQREPLVAPLASREQETRALSRNEARNRSD
jgi:hypothetical protein